MKRTTYTILYRRHLWVPLSALTQEQLRVLQHSLVVYPASQPMGVALWHRVNDHILLPRAFPLSALPGGWMVGEAPPTPLSSSPFLVNFSLDTRKVQGRSVPTGTSHQADALQAMHRMEWGGQIQLYCGGGKTAISLMYAAQKGQPFVVLADNTVLLSQWEQRIRQFLPEVAVVTADTRPSSWEKGDAVLSTYQGLSSLLRKNGLKGVADRFGTVFFDEAHHVSATTFSVCAEAFPGKRIGLTATPERSDGLSRIQELHLGPVVYRNLLAPLKPEVYFHRTHVRVDANGKGNRSTGNDDRDMAGLAADLGVIEERIQKVRSLLHTLVANGRKVLVLSTSITSLGNALAGYLGSAIRVARTEEDRPGVLKELMNGVRGVGLLTRELPSDLTSRKERVMFALSRFGREAYDDEELDTVLLLEPVREPGMIQQIAGRPCRLYPGKQPPEVHILVDDVHTLKDRARAMARYFRECPDFAGGPHTIHNR